MHDMLVWEMSNQNPAIWEAIAGTGANGETGTRRDERQIPGFARNDGDLGWVERVKTAGGTPALRGVTSARGAERRCSSRGRRAGSDARRWGRPTRLGRQEWLGRE